MIMDKQLMFSEAQAITATAVSTNVIDLSKVRDMGVGEELVICITVGATFTAAGAGTLAITLQTDDNAAMTSATVIYTHPTLALAALALGVDPIYIILPISPLWERYITLNYTVATGPMTAGNVTAGIILNIQKNRSYPKNYVSL